MFEKDRHRKLRPLLNTPVTLSALGLGTAPIGNRFLHLRETEVAGMLDLAWDAGIRYFDTAPFYGYGKAELRTGRALSDRRPRKDFVLSSKVGRLFRRPADPENVRPGIFVGGLPFAMHFDYSYDGIMRSVEDSYLRLGMTRIDLLLIHDLDHKFHPGQETLSAHRAQLLTGGLRALESLKAQGVIAAYGAGINHRGTIAWYLDNAPVDFFLAALIYTLLDNDSLDDELPMCAKAGVGLVIGSVFNSGILATGACADARYNYRPATPDILEKVKKISAVCREFDVTLAGAALQFPLAHPLVASVIPGAVSAKEVQMNINEINRNIPPEFWQALKERHLLRVDAPVPA